MESGHRETTEVPEPAATVLEINTAHLEFHMSFSPFCSRPSTLEVE
jgi:hypothetical protein